MVNKIRSLTWTIGLGHVSGAEVENPSKSQYSMRGENGTECEVREFEEEYFYQENCFLGGQTFLSWIHGSFLTLLIPAMN